MTCLGLSHPTHIPPIAWLRVLVWLVFCPKTFFVGQVPLSPVYPMSRKTLKPVTTHNLTALWLCWALFPSGETCLTGRRPTERRTGQLWIGLDPTVWTITGPRLSENKCIECTARAFNISTTFSHLLFLWKSMNYSILTRSWQHDCQTHVLTVTLSNMTVVSGRSW